MLLISEIMLTKWRRFWYTYRSAITTPNFNFGGFQVCCCQFICVLWPLNVQISCSHLWTGCKMLFNFLPLYTQSVFLMLFSGMQSKDDINELYERFSKFVVWHSRCLEKPKNKSFSRRISEDGGWQVVSLVRILSCIFCVQLIGAVVVLVSQDGELAARTCF